MRESPPFGPAGPRGWQLHAALLLVSAVAGPALAADGPAANSVTTPVLDLAETASLAMTMLKVFGALLLTVGLMLLIAAWIRKLGLGRAGLNQGRLINVLDTKMIAPKKYLAVVRIGGKTLAIGVTDQQITLLSALEADDVPAAASGGPERPPQATFAALLGKMMKRDGQ
jgi:flagellar biogenesis protein FliO